MNVDEYKEKFMALFDQLRYEQGNVRLVELEAEDYCDLTGNVIGAKVNCKIVFK